MLSIAEIRALDPRVRFDPHPRFFGFLEIVVSSARSAGIGKPPLEYYVSHVDYLRLEDGDGWLYGKALDGPWVHLKLFRHRVIGCKTVSDPELLSELDEAQEEHMERMQLLHKQLYGKKVVYLLDWLYDLHGMDRYRAILERCSEREIDETCRTIRKCSRCPLAIRYRDALGTKRLMCVDACSDRRIVNALSEGGEFIKKGVG